MFNSIIKLCRLNYWPKNIFLLPGVFFFVFLSNIENFYTIENLTILLLAILSTCLICSSNYVINELTDQKTDFYHPDKKKRPLVSQKLSISTSVIVFFFLSFFGYLLGINININFFYTLVILQLMGFVYNVKPLRFKDHAYLDVITESFNNLLRFALGWNIFNENYYPPLSLLIIFWTGGAFLMALKRLGEFRYLKKDLSKYRKSFKNYTESSLLLSSLFYALNCCLFIGVAIIKIKIEFILCTPFVSALFVYYLKLSLIKNSPVQHPELIFKDKNLFILVLSNVLVFLYALNAEIDYFKIFNLDLLNFS